jgi:hypothetical protein
MGLPGKEDVSAFEAAFGAAVVTQKPQQDGGAGDMEVCVRLLSAASFTSARVIGANVCLEPGHILHLKPAAAPWFSNERLLFEFSFSFDSSNVYLCQQRWQQNRCKVCML